ncbi:hypothetical protein KEH51_03925 [[Brevibacterium] frigoritolerans]|uniref:Uncharacterized protein n=1 Tax=Peribacillus frigoritolerans TaxID=450367 RepID=A0A941J9U8_9BACI|nr:hypothetical protein [Peribacillus frigoritolerans]
MEDDSGTAVVKKEQEMNGKQIRKKSKNHSRRYAGRIRRHSETLQHIIGFHKIVRKFAGKIQVKNSPGIVRSVLKTLHTPVF